VSTSDLKVSEKHFEEALKAGKQALFLDADPIHMTWGERDHYINCSGYVVVG